MRRRRLSTGFLIGTMAIVGLSTPGVARFTGHRGLFNTRVYRGQLTPPSLLPMTRMNILLVIADDLGIEALGSYQTAFGITGVTAATTPNIDSLQTNGVTFLNVWSNPMCTPSRAGIFSGKHVFNHGLGHPRDVADGTESLEASLALAGDSALPGYLPASYHSGLFGKWHLGGDGYVPGSTCSSGTYPASPQSLGWETHDGSWEEISAPDDTYCDWKTDVDGDCAELTTAADPNNYATTYVVDHALTWIESVNPSPWFATVALNAPHDPLHDPTSTDCAACTGTSRDCFLGLVSTVDTAVGDLIAGLQSKGELKDTMIIFVGDNGTGIGSATLVGATPTPYPTGHWKSSVYQGGVHVPLIIADGCYLENGTGSTECTSRLFLTRIDMPGRDEDALVHTLDLFATIANVARGWGTTTTWHDSVSLRPYLLSASASDQREFLYTDGDKSDGTSMCAIRNNQYKLVVYPCEDSNASGCELYDLDPAAGDYLTENDDLLTSAAAPPSELEDLVLAMASLRTDWTSHPCTDWVTP